MQRFAILLSLFSAYLAAAPAFAADELKTSIFGETFSINGNATQLGAAQWADPERSWRTVGELIKSAVPPADAAGRRAGVTLIVELDERAPWGALKALAMAASGLGIPTARILVPGKPNAQVMLDLPGADPSTGEVVPLPLSLSPSGNVMTENSGKKVDCSVATLQGLVKQLPKATVYVQAPPTLPANRVLGILRALKQDAKAGAVAYLPVKEITTGESAERQEAKDAVNRAFEGGLGGMGK